MQHELGQISHLLVCSLPHHLSSPYWFSSAVLPGKTHMHFTDWSDSEARFSTETNRNWASRQAWPSRFRHLTPLPFQKTYAKGHLRPGLGCLTQPSNSLGEQFLTFVYPDRHENWFSKHLSLSHPFHLPVICSASYFLPKLGHWCSGTPSLIGQ